MRRTRQNASVIALSNAVMRAGVKVVFAVSMIAGYAHFTCAAGHPEAPTVGQALPQNVRSTSIPIGQHSIDIKIADTGTELTFIRLHENEMPAGAVGVQMNREVPSRFIDLSQRRNRNISFALGGSRYTFDPNSIFTAGVVPITYGAPLSPAATQATTGLAETITGLLLPGAPVIALHNNRGTLLASYAHGPFKKYTHAVYVNRAMEASTFAVVPTRSLFEAVKKRGINVVWEDRAGMKDDGSLLAYAQRNNMAYVNIETALGSSAQAQLDVVRQMVPIVQAEALALRGL
jgi:hypothetical protein